MARTGQPAKEDRAAKREVEAAPGSRHNPPRRAEGRHASDGRGGPEGRDEPVVPTLALLRDPRAPYLVPILLLILARVLAWVEIKIPAEDAFITFRYARNLASGSGLVYNPGERVMGFTSPLWTLWCGAGYALLRNPLAWSRVWSIVADVVTLAVTARLLERNVSRASAWVLAIYFAAWPYFWASAVSGMEMSAFLMLVALSAAAIAGRAAWGGVALGALSLVRPEGVACAAVIALWSSWRQRLVAVALFGAGVLGLSLYYGSPIPQSLLAKSQLYGVAGPWPGRLWWDWLSPVVMGRWPRLQDTQMLVSQTLLLAPAFVVGARALWERRGAPITAMAAACLVVLLGYSLFGVAYFWWYLLVPLAGVAIVAAVGFPRIIRGPAIPIAVCLSLVSIWSVSRELYIGRAQQEAFSFGQASSRLSALARPGDHVLLEPIGMIGYYAPVVVIDEAGLVSPRVAARRLQGPGWYTDIVANERPEWLVVRAGVMSSGEAFAGRGAPFRSAEERQAVLNAYEEVARSGDENAGDTALLVLKRRP